MDAAESKMIQREAFPLADRWRALMRKHREQTDRLARSLYMATWTGTDPRQPMPTNQRAEWIRTKATYDGLTDRKLRSSSPKCLASYQNQNQTALQGTAKSHRPALLPAADKLAAKDMLRQEFRAHEGRRPYVPLMRFGDLTVFAEGRKEGEKPVFATFETVQDQRAFADWLKRATNRNGVKTERGGQASTPAGRFRGQAGRHYRQTTQGLKGRCPGCHVPTVPSLLAGTGHSQTLHPPPLRAGLHGGCATDLRDVRAPFPQSRSPGWRCDRMSDALEAMAKQRTGKDKPKSRSRRDTSSTNWRRVSSGP